MNMKMKAVAAAVTMAITGGANAAVGLLSSGNSELVFTVWDPVAVVSFNMDFTPQATASSMGTYTLNDFLPTGAAPGGKSGSSTAPTINGWAGATPGTAEAAGINWNWNVSGSTETAAAWNSFVTTVATNGSNSSNWQWFVGAGDTTGTTAANDQYRYVTTSKQDLTQVSITNTNLSGMKNSNPMWNAMDAGSQDADPSYAFTSGDGYVGQVHGNTWAGGAPFVSTGGLNESMNFFYLSGNCVGTVCETVSKADAQKFGNGAKFTFSQVGSQTTLNYSTNALPPPPAVPVPAAVWLLGSALVGLVGVARRKVAV